VRFRLSQLTLLSALACGLGLHGRGLALPLAGAAEPACITFDDLKAGTSPAGWEATETGIGTARWIVKKDVSAPSPAQVLEQSGEAQFPVCIYQKAELADGFVEVKFKPMAGLEDQAGGVIFRARDKNDYYVARANALEDTVELFHTLHSHRESVKSADIRVTAQHWHKLRAEFRGPHIKVYFDGKLLLQADDEALKGPGKVGVWTKSDSVTRFDDFCFGRLK
jgi:3-keto-disaccharide hydrolase